MCSSRTSHSAREATQLVDARVEVTQGLASPEVKKTPPKTPPSPVTTLSSLSENAPLERRGSGRHGRRRDKRRRGEHWRRAAGGSGGGELGRGEHRDPLERERSSRGCIRERRDRLLDGARERGPAGGHRARRRDARGRAESCAGLHFDKGGERVGEGGEREKQKKNQWIQLWRKNSKNPVSTPVSTLRDETPPPLFVSFFLSSLPLSVPRRSNTRIVCVSFCDRNYS